MRKIQLIVLILVSVSLFSLPVTVMAGKPENPGKPDNSICDELLQEGVTEGLWGLCVAYNTGGAGGQGLLDAYNDLKTPDDPIMPGTTPPCPCWTDEELIRDTSGLVAEGCYWDRDVEDDGFGFYSVSYHGDASAAYLQTIFFVDVGSCLYEKTDGTVIENTTLTDTQYNDCNVALEALITADFEGVCNE